MKNRGKKIGEEDTGEEAQEVRSRPWRGDDRGAENTVEARFAATLVDEMKF